jgi:hypothetical protein
MENIELPPSNRMSWYKQYSKMLFTGDTNAKFAAFIDKATERAFATNDPTRFWTRTELAKKNTRNWLFELSLYGDLFVEKVIIPNEKSVFHVQSLQADTMYRIETTTGRLLEFQQSKDGPDYKSLVTDSVGTALRFHPTLITHFRMDINPREPYGYKGSVMRTNPELWEPLCMDRLLNEFFENVHLAWGIEKQEPVWGKMGEWVPYKQHELCS